MKRKIFSILLTLVLVCSFSLVTAVPAPVMADEGTNYSPFGTVLYIWGADGGGLANAMKWWYIEGDGAQWDGHQITIVNSQWPEFNGQWYMKNTGAAERFTLWRDAALTDQVTTTNNGLIGDWDTPAAYAIDGWVEFDPEVDTVGDPRETVGNMSHMWYDHASCYGEGNLEVKFQSTVEHGFYDGWRLDLVECGWDDLNGTWFLEWVAEDGGTYADRYELYADAEFTQLGIPADPDKFVPYGGESGYLFGPRGRFVAPYEVWVDDDGSDTNPGTEDLPFATIVKGIGMVASGGTVNVEAGTYEENVVVDKMLTLQGEDRETTEIKFGYGAYPSEPPLIISADEVTVSGFTIRSGPYIEAAFGSSSGWAFTIIVDGDSALFTDLHVIKDLLLTYNDQPRDGGSAFWLAPSLEGFTLTDSTVVSEWDGIYTREEGIDITVRNVEFTYLGTFAIMLKQITGATIEGNKFTNTGNELGVLVSRGCEGIEIMDNKFTGSGSTDSSHIGILLQNFKTGPVGVSILGNDISDFDTGIKVEEGVATSGIQINYNNIHDNPEYGVLNEATEVDATNNWWGSPSGPAHALNTYTAPTGESQGDAVSDNVLYVPWHDTDMAGASFAPVTSEDGLFSSIQAAVNAATGTTITCVAGTYDEVVVVDESVNLLGANAGECAGVDPGDRGDESIVDAFHITVNNVVVDGFKIEGAKVGGSGDATNAIVLDGGTSGHTISNNILPGPGGTPPAGTDRGIVFGGDVSSTTVSCNEVYGWMSGIYINPTALGSNLLFQYNSIHHNWAGIGSDGLNDVSILNNNFSHNVEGFGSSNVGINVVVHFNNFCGNTTAIAHWGGEPIDATNNWWCHPSGPTASPGSGDPVSGNVLYNPWLLEPVDPEDPDPPTTYDKTLALNVDWTLVSTDSWIDPAQTVGEGVILAINYTPDDGWFEIDPTALVPVDALYLKTDVGGALGITYSGGVPIASSKELEAGWNLVSSATLTPASAVLSPLRFVQVGDEQGVGLTTLVSQGSLNQHTGSFYLSTFGDGDWGVLAGKMLNPFDGYWVYMNDGKVFGVVPE